MIPVASWCPRPSPLRQLLAGYDIVRPWPLQAHLSSWSQQGCIRQGARGSRRRRETWSVRALLRSPNILAGGAKGLPSPQQLGSGRQRLRAFDQGGLSAVRTARLERCGDALHHCVTGSFVQSKLGRRPHSIGHFHPQPAATIISHSAMRASPNGDLGWAQPQLQPRVCHCSGARLNKAHLLAAAHAICTPTVLASRCSWSGSLSVLRAAPAAAGSLSRLGAQLPRSLFPSATSLSRQPSRGSSETGKKGRPTKGSASAIPACKTCWQTGEQ